MVSKYEILNYLYHEIIYTGNPVTVSQMAGDFEGSAKYVMNSQTLVNFPNKRRNKTPWGNSIEKKLLVDKISCILLKLKSQVIRRKNGNGRFEYWLSEWTKKQIKEDYGGNVFLCPGAKKIRGSKMREWVKDRGKLFVDVRAGELV